MASDRGVGHAAVRRVEEALQGSCRDCFPGEILGYFPACARPTGGREQCNTAHDPSQTVRACALSRPIVEHPHRIMEQRYATILRALIALAALSMTGCPAYEDARSGTYRRAADGESPQAIEVFRAGDYVTVLVRTYSVARDDPFRDEISCSWSELDAPFDDDAQQFKVKLPRTTAQSEERELVASFLDDTRLSVSISGEQARIFELKSEEPDRRCEAAREFLLHADLSALPNTLPTTQHVMRRPVFSLLWLGVEPVRQSETIIWVGLNRTGSVVYLSDRNFDAMNNGLKGSLTLTIPTPEERDLVRSGSTRFALAHLVVIDDKGGCPADLATPCPAADRLSWSVSEEPLIASSLEPLGPDQILPDGATGQGKALLYVEGSISDLDPSLLARFTNLEEYIAQGRAEERFYLVDVTHDADTILRVSFAEDPLNRRVKLKATPRFLGASDIALPRLFPF